MSFQECESALNTAYRSHDPLETLNELISMNTITPQHIEWITQTIRTFETKFHTLYGPMQALHKDIRDSYGKEDALTKTALWSHFMYFALSMVHLWGEMDKTVFCMHRTKPVLCFTSFCQTAPFIWFNMVDTKLGNFVLIKSTLCSATDGYEMPFRVTIHRGWAPDRQDIIRFSYDFTTGHHKCTSQKYTHMLQLAIHWDKTTKQFTRMYATKGIRKWGNFCIILTRGERYELCYVGYNKVFPRQQCAEVYPCMATLHAE